MVTLSFPGSLAANSEGEAAAVAAPNIFTNERRFMISSFGVEAWLDELMGESRKKYRTMHWQILDLEVAVEQNLPYKHTFSRCVLLPRP
jgi:hypothetical protein